MASELLRELLSGMLGERAVDDALLERGFASGHRDVALRLAGRHLDIGAPHLLKAWFGLPQKRPEIESMLREDPLLALERRAGRPLPAPSPAGPDVQSWFGPARVARVMDALAAAPDDSATLERLCERLPGLQQLAFSDEAPLASELRTRLKEHFSARLRHRFPKQVSVIPSYYCDRSCPYCFNRAPHRSDMSFEQFCEILDRAAPDGDLTRVNLFGGEPTLFEGFFEFTEELERRGLKFFFSTHGIIDNERFGRIARMKNLEMVTFHVEKPSFYREGELGMLLQNIRAVARSGRMVVIRYNLVDAEVRDWSFLRPFFDEAPAAPFSFAVVFPSPKGKNRHAAVSDLPRFATKILKLVRYLEDERPQIPKLVLSKPFPLCAFSAADLRYLMRRIEYRNICEIDRRGYTDQIQVTPQLEVIPCMAMGAADYRLPGVASLEAMGEQFAERLAPVLQKPILSACRQCGLFAAGACQAACFSYAAHAEKSDDKRRLKVFQ